jgi:hypothetical protein
MPGRRKPAKWTDKERRFMFWAHPVLAERHYREIAKEKIAEHKKRAKAHKKKRRGRR